MTSIEQRLHELREMAREYAKAESQRQYLDHFRKSKLAILMQQYQRKGFDTAAAQDREARADIEYIRLLDGLKEAVETAERLRWHLKISMLGADLWRTKEATARQERKSYGA